MAFFQAGYIGISGKPELGLVAIDRKANRVQVRLFTDNSHSTDLGRFSKHEWLDQDVVNATLRSRGLLWRRTKTENEYRKSAR